MSWCIRGSDGEVAFIHLRSDGTILPVADVEREGYWLIYNKNDRPILALASQSRILYEFKRTADGGWECVCRLRQAFDTERALTQRLEHQRWFQYERIDSMHASSSYFLEVELVKGQGGVNTIGTSSHRGRAQLKDSRWCWPGGVAKPAASARIPM